jgi:hypothetical protein
MAATECPCRRLLTRTDQPSTCAPRAGGGGTGCGAKLCVIQFTRTASSFTPRFTPTSRASSPAVPSKRSRPSLTSLLPVPQDSKIRSVVRASEGVPLLDVGSNRSEHLFAVDVELAATLGEPTCDSSAPAMVSPASGAEAARPHCRDVVLFRAYVIRRANEGCRRPGGPYRASGRCPSRRRLLTGCGSETLTVDRARRAGTLRRGGAALAGAIGATVALTAVVTSARTDIEAFARSARRGVAVVDI